LILRVQGIWEIYPAAGALASMGEKALPAVLRVIESESTSAKACENAVFVWMEIYKYEHSRGITTLRHELDQTRERGLKQQLQWAVAKALDWCNPDEQDSCQKAAKPGSS
jgi:hypothetical protein